MNSKKKTQQIDREHKEFVDNLHKLLQGDTKIASKPLLIGELPNIFYKCNKLNEINITERTKLIILKKTIDKIMRPEILDSDGKRTKKSGHFLTEKQIIEVINELKYPSIIFNGSIKESLVAVTNLKDNKEHNIIVSLLFNKQQGTQQITEITSIYGKELIQNYIKNNIENNNVVAIHKEKAKEMLLTIGVDFPEANTFISFDDSIAYTELSVNNK